MNLTLASDTSVWRGKCALGVAWILSLVASSLGATISGQQIQPQFGDRISQQIERLGSTSFQERQQANRELLDFGQAALPQLFQAAIHSTEAEIRFRASELARQISQSDCQSPTLGMQFIYLRQGQFRMGSPPGEPERREDEQAHTVKISRPFLIGKKEVTQREYQAIMDSQPSWYSEGGGGQGKIKNLSTDEFPVESVTWFDAIEFCNRLSENDGLSPYYKIEGTQRNKGKIVSAEVRVIGGTGYRLPTEAEWEFACRAGTTTPHHFVNEDRNGNYKHSIGTGYGSSTYKLGSTTNVGSYPANAWGLHDMHGNAAEWCWDWYSDGYYANSPWQDPSGPNDGKHRALRGGSFPLSYLKCRSASRFWFAPGTTSHYIGFRVARDAAPRAQLDAKENDAKENDAKENDAKER